MHIVKNNKNKKRGTFQGIFVGGFAEKRGGRKSKPKTPSEAQRSGGKYSKKYFLQFDNVTQFFQTKINTKIKIKTGVPSRGFSQGVSLVSEGVENPRPDPQRSVAKRWKIFRQKSEIGLSSQEKPQGKVKKLGLSS